MPVLKPISGHTSCKGPFFYLTKGGRALASDYLNLDVPNQTDLGNVFPWYREMDETRENAGHNRPWGGRPPRTYKHYIVSPDPEDGIDLVLLRDLTTAWAEKHFGDYQCAIVYHDDNENRIPHAHVIVNCTNLDTGRKLQDPDPTNLNNSLQALAKERMLRHFRDDREIEAGKNRAQFVSKAERLKSYQQEYERRSEEQLKEEGKYSWVADIRARVKVARAVTRSEAELKNLLGELGVQVSNNSAKAARPDWIYALKDAPTRRVSGEKLGLAYGKESLLARFEQRSLLDEPSGQRVAEIARNAVMVRDLTQLQRLADAVKLIESRKITSVIGLESYMRKPFARQAWNDLRQDEAEAASRLIEDESMLPFRISSSIKVVPETSEQAYAKTRPIRRSDGSDGAEHTLQRDNPTPTQQHDRQRNEQER